MLPDTPYWLALHLVEGIGSARLLALIAHFESAKEAWEAPERALLAVGIGENAVSRLIGFRSKCNLEAELEKLVRMDVHLLTLADEDYPLLLRKIGDPPPLLYVRGQLLEADRVPLAVVGTRNATQYGREVAFRLSQQLADRGVTIVSGLAEGVDVSAHRGALQAKGRTVAVLGSGMDRIYPDKHRSLADEIIENGALLSEFPLGTPPLGANFPRRNRIISGMSFGVLVAEAPEGSGALITANLALEQGRDVFAVPSGIFNLKGLGANRLIQEGAKLVITAEDVLNELNLAVTKAEVRQVAESVSTDTPQEAQIVALLSDSPLHVDEITRTLGLPTHEVMATLMLLELKGLAQMVGTMHYCRSYA